MQNAISVILFFPLVAAFLGTMLTREGARTYGIITTGITFILSLGLWAGYDLSIGGYQFLEKAPLVSSFGINYLVGIDGISLFLVILTTFMSLICMIGLDIEKNVKNFVLTLLALETAMIGVFVALDTVVFYIFWEFSLVPMFYIVGAWGSERRIYAAIKFFLYTFAGSLLMLLAMLFIAWQYQKLTGVWSFSLIDWNSTMLFRFDVQMWLFLAFFVGFAIKVPMFPFHTWLPYAHGQAPTIGSVVLAAVLLKMGSYGFIRFSLPLFPDASVYMMWPVAIIALIMIVYTAMIAYAQEDMKQVIAYSSISHMGVIVLGTFAMNVEGITGSVFLMISHGIVSGALFMLVGVIYNRLHTKNMSQFGGITKSMPQYSIIFGIMLMGSVGLPLTIGFVGEFLSLLGFYKVSAVYTAIAGTTIILGAAYMLRLFKRSFFGEITNGEIRHLKDLNGRELSALLPLTALVIILGIYPKPVLTVIDKGAKEVIAQMYHKATLVDTKKALINYNMNGGSK